MRLQRWTLTAAACGLAISTQALAGPPASLDRVPGDAAVTVVIPNLQGFFDDMKTFGQAVMPADQMMEMNMGLAMAQAFLDMPGINSGGSAAAVIYVSEDEAYAGPPVVLLLPIGDFGQLRESVGALGSGPVYEANMGGNELYLKDVGGGFAAVGPLAELVQEFKGKAGNLGGHMSRIGASGEEVLEGNDITMIANLEILSPYIREAANQMKDQMGMMMMMAGPEAQQGQAAIDMLTGSMDAIAEDGQAGIVGLQMSPEGFSFDTGVQFQDGTASAKLLAEKGDTASLLDRLPAADFMFAYALDTGNAGVRTVFESLAAAAAEAGEQPTGISFMDMIKDATGIAGEMGSVPMMGAGLFSNMVTVTMTGDANSAVGAMKETLTAMDGQSAQGFKYITSFESGAAQIDGVDVSRFAMTMQPDGSGDGAAFGPAQMIMPMLFGPQGGPNGFIAAVDGAVVQTLSQNTPLMEKAISAVRNGGGLGTSDSVKMVAGRLPSNRIFEFYLSIDQVMNTVGPMAATFGALPGFERLDAMAPVGIGASIGDGGLVNRIHIPNEVIGWIVEFSQQMQADEFEGEDEFEPDF